MLMHQITSNVFSKYRCMQTKEIIENPNQILNSTILNKYDKLHRHIEYFHDIKGEELYCRASNYVRSSKHSMYTNFITNTGFVI